MDVEVLNRFACFSHGRESSPLRLDRPDSHSNVLRLRDRLPSSSSVESGRRNSRGAPPGAWTIQPRIVRMPDSNAIPDIVTGWYELAGTVRARGFVSIAAPEVLQVAPADKRQHRGNISVVYLNARLANSKSKI